MKLHALLFLISVVLTVALSAPTRQDGTAELEMLLRPDSSENKSTTDMDSSFSNEFDKQYLRFGNLMANIEQETNKELRRYVNRTVNFLMNRLIKPAVVAQLLRTERVPKSKNDLLESIFDRRPPPRTRLTNVSSRPAFPRPSLARPSQSVRMESVGRDTSHEMNAKIQGFLRKIAPFLLKKVFGG